MSRSPGHGSQGRPGNRVGRVLGGAGIAAVPIAMAVAIRSSGVDLQTGAVLAGAAGWMVALALRTPIVPLGQRLGAKKRVLEAIVVGSSGPLEETVRLGTLMLFSRSLENALSIGFGWATIEVVFTFASSMAAPVSGNRAPAKLGAVAWGALERLWASALHLGFSLAIAANGLLVLLAAAAHTATNLLVWFALSRGHGIARVEIAGTIWGVVVLTLGIALWM
jgi:hypothetical protein